MEGCYKELANLMISNGAINHNPGLGVAYEYGHENIVDLLIILGADDWNLCLIEACGSGHTKTIKLMIHEDQRRSDEGCLAWSGLSLIGTAV